MKTPDPSPADEALDELAAAWLLERAEGFAPGRAAAFAAWCVHPRHAAAVARVERTLALLDEMPAVRAPLERRFAVPAPSRAWWRRPAPAWALGMAAVLAIGLALWPPAPPAAAAAERYATEGAAQRRIVLRDGSAIDLNGHSRVSVRLGPQERRVTLEAGEAHFQVAHDTARPFIVSAGGVAVRAVGTAFNVRLAGTEVAVLVTEGRVRVAREAPPTASPAAAAPAAELGAQERTVLPIATASAPTAPPVERVTPQEMRTLLAWQSPVVTFVDTPLREVVAQFNRRNARQLVLEDPELRERKIGGVIALDQVDAFVRLLEQEGEIAAEPRGDTLVLRRAR